MSPYWNTTITIGIRWPAGAVYSAERHESLKNLTPADVYFGRGQTILLERERIKRDTFKQRGLQYRRQAA